MMRLLLLALLWPTLALGAPQGFVIVTPDDQPISATNPLSVNTYCWNGSAVVMCPTASGGGGGGTVGIDQVTPGANGVVVNSGSVSVGNFPATQTLGASAAIAGKFGIDQTTPGTTNGVQVNAALPAGANVIGKAGIDQTTPGTTNGVQVNAALPVGANVVGKFGIDQSVPGTSNTVQISVAAPASITAGAAMTVSIAGSALTVANVKTSAGNIYGVSCAQTNASLTYVQFYNTAGTPTLGTSVVWFLAIPASGTLNIPPGTFALANFTTGIGIGASTTPTGVGTPGVAPACTVFYK
jgi:hypothetical protein